MSGGGGSLAKPLPTFLSVPCACLLFPMLQSARHKLHLVLEPSQVCPLLPVAYLPLAAPQTPAAPPPAAAVRPLSLLSAWLPGQEDPRGLSPAACWAWYFFLLPLDKGWPARGTYSTDTHTSSYVNTVHTHTEVHTQ